MKSVVATVVALLVVVASAKHCVFLHGAGILDEGPPTNTYPEYWGKINSFTPQCDDWIFNHADTVTNAFDNSTLMQSYCDVATNSTGGSIIKDSIVFTHSMGNVILAAAIRGGLCSLDSSSTWYLAAPPTTGSKASDLVEDICNSTNWLDGPIRDIATLLHFCVNDQPGDANLAYVSLQTDYPALQGLPEIMTAHANGAICGNSPFGLVSIYSLGLEALSVLVDYGEPSDGMVPMSSCQAGLDPNQFGDDANSNFYLAAVNHADSTCRDGNGVFGADRQPCAWFGARV